MVYPASRLTAWRAWQPQLFYCAIDPVPQLTRHTGDIQPQQQLKTILLNQVSERAKTKVAIVAAQQQRQFVRLGAQFRVQNPQSAVAALNQAGFVACACALVPA